MQTREELVAFADALLDGARQFASDDYALITLPGPTGGRGARVDGLEGFARTFMLAAFRIAGSSQGDPKAQELAAWYLKGITAGVDPSNANGWIRQSEASQARVEAASIALGLDMVREQVWDRLSSDTKARLIEYLAEVVGDDDYPQNNWLWFRVVVETFLRSVGGPWSAQDITSDLLLYDSLDRGNGWFTDGQGRKFDHYAGWAMHLYPTLWARMRGADQLIEQVDPGRQQRDAAKLDRYLRDAVALVGADGSPLIQGRSLIYRFAAAAPFWAGAIAGTKAVSMGQLRCAALSMVGHFQANGAPNHTGTLDLGWHSQWPRMSQSYSGPSSAYWASKGLLGISLPADHPVWTAPNEPLPVQAADLTTVIDAPGWIVSATMNDGIVRIFNHGTDNDNVFCSATDSPLYSRFAYSTATAPLQREVDLEAPSDQAVTLIDAQGRRSHRSGMTYMGSQSAGVASSLNPLRWVDVKPSGDRFGGGLVGISQPAGSVCVHSIVHGSLELRIVRLLSFAHQAKMLRCSGWPISGRSVKAEVSQKTASVTSDQGLFASLSVPGGSDWPIPDGCDCEVVGEATFLGPRTAYSYFDFTPHAGKDYAVVSDLSRVTAHQRSAASEVHADREVGPNGELVLSITWPDGDRQRVTLDTFAEKLVRASQESVSIIADVMRKFRGTYPDDHTVEGRYPLRTDDHGNNHGANVGWTSGFWVGECAMAYQLTGDPSFLESLEYHLGSFSDRLTDRVEVEHHDIGFLYSLAGTLPYYLTGDERLRDMTLKAADVLMERYLENAGIIQAWGDLSDPTQRGRAIIDSLMNLPLLYWASLQSGDQRYERAARRHAGRLLDHIIRDDNTTHHTYYFDPETGKALYGKTAQGAADDSTWARGQAWGIYGFALSYRHTGDPKMLDGAIRCADRFLELLPEDSVPFWDMVFTDGDQEPRDSSAGAIAVCGLLELAEALAGRGRYELAEKYQTFAMRIMESLVENYATKPGQSDALIDHSVYSKPDGRGIDEGTIWGDYFYVEALNRFLNPGWINPWFPPSASPKVTDARTDDSTGREHRSNIRQPKEVK